MSTERSPDTMMVNPPYTTGQRVPVIAIVIRTLIVIALIGASAVFYMALLRSRPVIDETHGDVEPRMYVIKTQPVHIRRQWQGYGSAQSRSEADVPSRIASTVISIPGEVMPGARVVAGQVLVVLDYADLELEYNAALEMILELDAKSEDLSIELDALELRLAITEERLSLTRVDYDRVHAALDLGAALPSELDAARRALLEMQEAFAVISSQRDAMRPRRLALESSRRHLVIRSQQAALQIQRCSIRSPIPGILQAVDVMVGESLQPGQRVARVIDPRLMEVEMHLPASALGSIQEGDEIVIRSTGQSKREWRHVVSRIVPEIDHLTRTMTVYIDIEQEGGSDGLAPGQFLGGTILGGEGQLRTIIPARSLRSDQVHIVRADGTVATRHVVGAFPVEGYWKQFGTRDMEWIALHDTLPAGTLVILSPTRHVIDGMAVEAIVRSREGESP